MTDIEMPGWAKADTVNCADYARKRTRSSCVSVRHRTLVAGRIPQTCCGWTRSGRKSKT